MLLRHRIEVSILSGHRQVKFLFKLCRAGDHECITVSRLKLRSRFFKKVDPLFGAQAMNMSAAPAAREADPPCSQTARPAALTS